jgi:hypothetical protein
LPYEHDAIPWFGSGKVEEKGDLEKPHPFQVSLRLQLTLRSTPMHLRAMNMNIKPAVNPSTNGEPEVPDIQAQTESAAGPNRWSAAVQSWLVEFQQQARGESLPAFDTLFKHALMQ